MWYEVTVLSWIGFWIAVGIGCKAANSEVKGFTEILTVGMPIVILTICKLIWG